MSDEITSGIDELGVLLMGHGLTSWWTGSQLDIHEARQLVPGQNATTLQVAAAVLGGVGLHDRNPWKGILVPDELPHEEILDVAGAYLGTCPSVRSTGRRSRAAPACSRSGAPRPWTRGTSGSSPASPWSHKRQIPS